ncbi:translocation/assembly module TamB domain-containing protein, partial [Thiobacillus sp.]
HADLALTLQATARGAFEGRVDARGVHLAGHSVAALSASLDGQRAAHTLALDVSLPQGRLNATLRGGLGADSVWRGQLKQASLQGEWPIMLAAPAALEFGRTQQQVDGLALAVAGGRVAVEHFSRRGAQLASRGSVDRFPLAPLLDLLGAGPRFTTDLRFAGDWNLRAGETLDGTLSLRRQSGDLRLADPALQLGLEALHLDLVAAANRVDAGLAVESARAGQVHATARAALVREGAAFTLNRAAPLAWNARFDVPDLRLAKAFLPVGIRLDAHLVGRLDGSGSIAAPRIDGVVDAQQIRFAMPEQGVAIGDGTLKLALAGDRVRVQQGELKGAGGPGGGGRIRVSGEAQLRNPQAGLTLEFEKFAATQRSDRQVIVSGTTRLALDPRRIELSGELTADRARLEMPAASRPMLSDDVVVVGRPPREEPVAQRLPLALDLQLRLGSDFLFDGAGLDARLGGELRVFTVDKLVRGEGMIRVEEGRYSAYGQTLAIERGVLRFIGPIDNPGLDVLAVRVTPTVKVGVQVGGTVQRPLVKLYSDPPLPDTEKLAWLVLGHGLEGSGQEEFVLMQVAAGALLSQAESVNVQAKLAETLGIDTFDVRSGAGEDLTSTVVSLGKRLSSRATLSYERSLDGLQQVVKVLYQLTPHVRLEAQAGQQSSFDAFYTLEYD